ncbi:hypothetical protein CAEBREN_25646 [Caenorhabditis brenneri]|uniref:Uncharacterized protein n=1 Tax=Caenorhabditis brenneri TaxID=135651 RepID=G0N6T2_CAEBE|nr:hypothetical protein CAEBREN_25646 [Caenorhabditis brenneri]
MFYYYFLLFFFLLGGASCQQEVPTLIPKCIDEFSQLLGCAKNETVFQHIYDYDFFDVYFDRALYSEIAKVVNCPAAASCNVSMFFKSYVSFQISLIDLFDKQLQTRLTKKTYDEIVKTCNRIPQPPLPFYDPCDTADRDKCLVQEAAKLPNWSEKDVKLFEHLLSYLHAKCKMKDEQGRFVKPYIDAVIGSS